MSNGYTQGACPHCGSSDAHTIWLNGSIHCFSCGFHSQEKDDTLDALKSSFTQGKSSDIPQLIRLPDDFRYSLPELGYNWLNNYQLSVTEIVDNRIGWSDKYESLCFPVYGVGMELLMYQRRYFGTDPKIPKWITKGNPKDIVHIPKQHLNDDTIVLVEDLISAIKGCRITNCMPIFGSHLSDTTAFRISKMFSEFRIWFDADAQRSALDASFKLCELGMHGFPIASLYDPKVYSTNDLRDHMELYLDK